MLPQRTRLATARLCVLLGSGSGCVGEIDEVAKKPSAGWPRASTLDGATPGSGAVAQAVPNPVTAVLEPTFSGSAVGSK